MTKMLALALLPLLVIGLIEIGLSIPLILHKVPPNGFYGFRVAKTLSNEDTWYKANEFSGKLMLVSGVMALILAGILWRLHPTISFVAMEVISFAGIVIPLGVAVVVSFLSLSRLQ